MKGPDLAQSYNQKNHFTVIALTGRTGSGCSNVAKQISLGFVKEDFPNPQNPNFDLKHNSYKKYDIIYRFAKENFGPFHLICYREVLTLFLLKYSFIEFIAFLKSEDVKLYFQNSKISPAPDFSPEIKKLNDIRVSFDHYKNIFDKIQLEKIKENKNGNDLYNLFFSPDFTAFSKDFHSIFRSSFYYKHNLLFQLIANNIRKGGNPYKNNDLNGSEIFSLAEMINKIIKAIRIVKKTSAAKVVIDSLRNPFEVMFFKQRYAAFYLIAVNRDDKDREKYLNETYKDEYSILKELLEDEYKGGKGKEFYKQYIRACIEKADIHITSRKDTEVDNLNEKRKEDKENTSPYYTSRMQLLKYLALIEKPGLVTPSPEERCMQLAYTAKYNSGCISRQVGASISDEHYSIKAIGWNNTPSGQVPCSLRNVETLLKESQDTILWDLEKKYENQDPHLSAFTPYEKTNREFRSIIQENYEEQIKTNKEKLNGRNVSFCFKTLQNSCSEGKNQVHTRSLHAEESAFLQITKYGGTGIKDGKLFTTASPCELCAKKAYQLGIKVIYYVDPYPGISQEQILQAGANKPEVRLFNGAIGNAYHRLYEPLMAYKDELSLILNQNIEDLTSKQNKKIESQKEIIKALELENEKLKKLSRRRK